MPRGIYIRTKLIKEQYSKQKIGKNNPNYKHGGRAKKPKRKPNKGIIAIQEAREKFLSETLYNRDYLFRRYCMEETPIQKIAKYLKVEYDVVWFQLKEFGIPRISMVGRKIWHKWVEKQLRQHKNYLQPKPL